MIRVLIVDDSATARAFLREILGNDPGIEVVGAVEGGAEAIDFIRQRRPDVVTMDINMPRMDGFEATRRIMETTPLPVVIVSGLSVAEQRASFPAFEAGALAVVPRPRGAGHAEHGESVQELISTVKAMAEVRVVRRWPKPAEPGAGPSSEQKRPPPPRGRRIVALGASTGGPATLRTILMALPKNFPVPVVVVQHMSPGFLKGFADWLGASTDRPVHLPAHGEELLPGHIYVAPEKHQMNVTREGFVELVDPEENRGNICPTVSWLFRSIAESYGPNAIAVLLTGMGRDGADSMKLLKEAGATTIAQNAESCVVNGMPFEAIKLNVVDYVLPPDRISALLAELAEAESAAPGEPAEN